MKRHLIALLLPTLALAACTLANDPQPAGPVYAGIQADEVTLRAPEGDSEFHVSAEAYLLAQATTGGEPVIGTPAEVEQGAEGPTGIVEGRVESGGGGPLPGELLVTLHGIDPAEPDPLGAEFFVLSVPVDRAGGYRFEGVPFETQGAVYRVSTTIDGVTFSAEAQAGPGTARIALPLTLHEITSDPAVVGVDTLGLRIDGRAGVIEVLAVYSLANTGGAVYATAQPIRGGARGGVTLTVPDGAYNITLGDGRADRPFQQQGNEVITYDPLFPGPLPYPVVLRYLLPPSDSPALPAMPAYHAEQAVLLLDPAYQAAGFESEQVSTFDGVPYREYTADEVEAGGLALALSPAVSEDDDRATFAIALGLAAGLLLTAYGVVIALTGAPPPTLDHLDRDGARLLRAIAALDARHRAGEIDRITWQAERAALKADLAERLENPQ